VTLFDEGLKILSRRKIVFAERFIPYFFMSYGSHIFNLMNKRRRIYYEHSRIPDMRLHLLFVAPPGFCLDPNTRVRLENGEWKRIEYLQLGDRLEACNFLTLDNIEENRVQSIWRSIHPLIYEIRLKGKQKPNTIRASPLHLFWTRAGWTPAYKLLPRIKLMFFDEEGEGKFREVSHLRVLPNRYNIPYIDIETTLDHFIANGVLVHNSKSFFMKQCFSEDFGILNTPSIKTTFQGSCTEAGFVGTIEKNKGKPIKRIGLAEEYSDGIVAIEEFTAITRVLEQKHSLTFEAQLNSALFGGDVHKRLASGSISYKTNVTLIAGTQIAKFDISGGLGRRLNYIYWVPSPRDFRALIDAVREGANIPLDKKSLIEYRNDLMNLQKALDQIRAITFSKDLYDFFNGRPHFEHLIYRKMALGYNLFTNPISPSYEVVLDARLKMLIKKAMQWRDELLADPEGSQVITILKRRGGIMSKEDLQTELLKYSINWESSSYIIDKLLRLRKIRWTRGGKLAVV